MSREILFQRLKDTILNRVTFPYRIFGPLDVKDQLLLSLQLFMARHQTSKADGKLLMETGNLSTNIHNLTEGAQVEVHDWRVHVLRNEYWGMENKNESGDVLREDKPSIVSIAFRRNLRELVDQWKAGKSHVKAQPYQGRFSITFTLQEPNYLVRIIPWVAFFLSIANFFRG